MPVENRADIKCPHNNCQVVPDHFDIEDQSDDHPGYLYHLNIRCGACGRLLMTVATPEPPNIGTARRIARGKR